MQALVCHHLSPDRSGLRFEAAWPDPAPPQPGEVHINITAAALNFPDLLMLSGGYQYRPETPFIPGTEACGIVISGDLPPDTRVIIGARSGAFAQRITVPTTAVRPVPPGLTDPQAAAFTVGALTAWVGLIERGRLAAGERVLVTGAGGGMGLAAIALAAAKGAYVIAAASTPARLEAATAAGAHETILLDRSNPHIPHKDIDLIFDPVSGNLAMPAIKSLRRYGRYLIIGFTAGRPDPFPLNRALLSEIEIIGVRAGEQGRQNPPAGRAHLAAIDALALPPRIGLLLPLGQGAKAFTAMACAAITGKAVLVI